ncbi:MAG: amidohydrolase family protein, partial [bacterium]
LGRRRFLALAGGTAAHLAAGACGSDRADPGTAERETEEDVARLAAQKRRERARSGKGPFGPQRYRGYRGLAELPWFELDSEGVLRCVDESVPRAIDCHCHLGMSVLFEPDLDLHARTPRVRHLLDCDATQPGCELDLDVYINANFEEADLRGLRWNTLTQGLWGNPVVRTHTIPNLLDEMDATRVEAAWILPIRFGLPFGDALTESWTRAVREAGVADRLRVGCSVHPRDERCLERLEAFARAGARVLKLHPTMQRFYPDEPALMPIYEAAERLGLVVFFHGGRAGIEPESTRRHALPRHYEGAFAGFPGLSFVVGHGGARDGEAMLDLARRYENVWLGTHGQSVTHLDAMIRETGGERLLFGTDWPFYHLGASLAKILLVTRAPEREGVRRAILRDNALRLMSA